MLGYSTTLDNQSSVSSLPGELVTPSETTNRLIYLCIKVIQQRTDPRALGMVLDNYTTEVLNAREHFKKQTDRDFPQPVKIAVQNVLLSFQNYIDVLVYIRSWFTSPQRYPLAEVPNRIFDTYAELHNLLLAYEWTYLCQGDNPHPAINLMEKVVKAVKQGELNDERLSEIFDRLWDHFTSGLSTFERDPDISRKTRGTQAVHQILAGIQSMDLYFQQHSLSVLDSGFKKFAESCLLLVELMQDSTGEALADKPSPSPQVNWVIHAARAVLDGMDPNILQRAQNWFEPRLAESYFRFEQCADQALESSPKLAEQVTTAREGFNRLNRALPLLRLGVERLNLLDKAIQYLESGAELLHQAWQVFTRFEGLVNAVRCIHCGCENQTYSKVCVSCGARLVIPITGYQDLDSTPAVTVNRDEEDTSDHLSRLLEACDAAKFARISRSEFADTVNWGKQLLRNASSGLNELPKSSDDPGINRALHALRQGVEEFQQGIDEMQWWVDTKANTHLDIASHILLQAYNHFLEVQEMAAES
ncbi:MAG: hypothetical protein K6A35_04735 [bacterium]|nr:hypothetical protein [bacterium]